MLQAEEIRSMLPQLRSDDILGGSFCSTDGFVDPYSAMNGFMASAIEKGATLWKKTELTGIVKDPDGVAGVDTTRGRVATRKVVNAAGAWAAQVAAMAGIELPVRPLRRMLVPSEPFDDFPHSSPMVIDMSTGFHFRPEGRGFLLAWNDPRRKRLATSQTLSHPLSRKSWFGRPIECPSLKTLPSTQNEPGRVFMRCRPITMQSWARSPVFLASIWPTALAAMA